MWGLWARVFEVPLQFLEENARPSPLTVEWEVPSGPTMGKLGTGPRQGCDRYLAPCTGSSSSTDTFTTFLGGRVGGSVRYRSINPGDKTP